MYVMSSINSDVKNDFAILNLIVQHNYIMYEQLIIEPHLQT